MLRLTDRLCVFKTVVVFLIVASWLTIAPHGADAQSLQASYKRGQQLYKLGKYDEALTFAERAARLARRRFGRRGVRYALTLDFVANCQMALGQYSASERTFLQALAIIQRKLGPTHPAVASVKNNLAGLYSAQGRLKDALKVLSDAVRDAERKFGANSTRLGNRLSNLASLYQKLGRIDEAEAIYKRIVDIYGRARGRNGYLGVAGSLNNLAYFQDAQGRYREAAELYERTLSILEAARKKHLKEKAIIYGNLATVYSAQGAFLKPDRLHKRAIETNLKIHGPNHLETATALNNFAVMLHQQGRMDEAAGVFRKTIDIIGKRLGGQHPRLAEQNRKLARVLIALNKTDDAIALYRQNLGVFETSVGKSHPDYATALTDLANVHRRNKELPEAEALYRQALVIVKAALGEQHPYFANSLTNLGTALYDLERFDEAEAVYLQALKIGETRLGRDHPDVFGELNNLGHLYKAKGDHQQAGTYLSRAINILERAHGPKHRNLAFRLAEIASHDSDLKRWHEAYSMFVKASAALRPPDPANSIKQPDGRRSSGRWTDADVFAGLAQSAWFLSLKEPERKPALMAEAFLSAQRSGRSSAQVALRQMAVRFGSGDGMLAKLVRERQDLSGQRRALDKQLVTALSARTPAHNKVLVETLRARLADVDDRLAKLSAEIAHEFPRYTELARPQPLDIAATQRLLGASEAVIQYLVTDDESYVWAVTREGVVWRRIDVNGAALEVEIAALRATLNPAAAVDSARGFSRETVCRGFEKAEPCAAYDTDLKRAHRLYQWLIAPFADHIGEKQHLMIVPSGPLSGLPFHMMLTEAPPGAGELAERFRQAAWLIRQHAVSVLPSVSSLRALRVLASEGRAERAFVGFGNPQFQTPDERVPDRRSVATRGFASFFEGPSVNAQAIRAALPPLPDTAHELRAVGKLLSAGDGDIILGRRANEATIKAMSATGRLDDYRIVHFATHGLVAGDIDGLAEPALALSLPARPTEVDDGLLTASEVASLKLNADWVVLSACNTAAGNKPGAAALSGLARAFFYSGTRALLVSHWPVISEAAVKLTTVALGEMTASPAVGRAEALRRSMLKLIDRGTPQQRHPAYWAPFVVVGEGAAARP